MKPRVSGGAFLGAAALACAGWLVYYSGGAIAREANRVMEEEVARGKFSGVALISRDGHVIFEKAYGLANVEWNVPNSTSTKFRIGSITKSFTAVLVLQLEQEKRLRLGDSICGYLGECPSGWHAITLHHLLSNTSGIYNFTNAPEADALRATPQTREEMLERFVHQPLAFAPGEKFEYSNSNFYLLGLVVEKVTGEPYEKALRRHILDPLGMRDTGIASREGILVKRASGYRYDSRGRLDNDVDIHESWSSAAGALYSTVEDLAKFSEALATDKLLPRVTVELMWRAVKDQYGYGWQTPPIAARTLNRRVVEHGGRVPGFVATLRRFVDDGLTVVVLSNCLDARPERVATALSTIAFGDPYKSVFDRQAIQLSPEARRRLLGNYEFEGEIFTISDRAGRLIARTGDSPEIEILAESEGVLFIPGDDNNLEPIENSKGQVVGITVSMNNGSVRIARKVD